MGLKINIDNSTQYEYPSAQLRAFAFIVDYLIILCAVTFPLYSFKIFPRAFGYSGSVTVASLVLYKIIFESWFGTTIGKKIFNLTVLDNKLNHASIKYIFKRYLVYIFLIIAGMIYNLLFIHVQAKITISGREPIFIISYILGVLVYIFAFVDFISIHGDPQKMNRALHDRIAQTITIRVLKLND